MVLESIGGQPCNETNSKEVHMLQNRYKQSPMRRLNLEMPADLCDKVEDAAIKAGLARTAYIRKVLAESVVPVSATT